MKENALFLSVKEINCLKLCPSIVCINERKLHQRMSSVLKHSPISVKQINCLKLCPSIVCIRERKLHQRMSSVLKFTNICETNKLLKTLKHVCIFKQFCSEAFTNKLLQLLKIPSKHKNSFRQDKKKLEIEVTSTYL